MVGQRALARKPLAADGAEARRARGDARRRRVARRRRAQLVLGGREGRHARDFALQVHAVQVAAVVRRARSAGGQDLQTRHAGHRGARGARGRDGGHGGGKMISKGGKATFVASPTGFRERAGEDERRLEAELGDLAGFS